MGRISVFFRTFGLCFGLATAIPVSAQIIGPGESFARYGDARGWQVFAISMGGGHLSCRAFAFSDSGRLVLEQQQDYIQIMVESAQQGRFVGGILGFGKSDIDTQFGLANGYAYTELFGTMLQQFKSGSEVSVEVNGDPVRRWSLYGSSAALLKLNECEANGGVAPS